MADNVAITPGTGTTVAADDIGGVHHQRVKLVVGSDGVSEGDTSTSNPLPIREAPLVATGNTITRPANTTAYAFGDIVANSTTAGSVTPFSFTAARVNDQAATVIRARLKKSGTTLTNAIFRLHLYNLSPTVTNGDNGVWLSTESGYLGSLDITVDKAFSDAATGVGVPTAGSTIAFVPATGTQIIYGLLEVRAAYTPASAETFTPYLEIQ